MEIKTINLTKQQKVELSFNSDKDLSDILDKDIFTKDDMCVIWKHLNKSFKGSILTSNLYYVFKPFIDAYHSSIIQNIHQPKIEKIMTEFEKNKKMKLWKCEAFINLDDKLKGLTFNNFEIYQNDSLLSVDEITMLVKIISQLKQV